MGISQSTSSFQEYETRTLIRLVHKLPPELFNEIYDLTFTAPSAEQHIGSSYKPPSCLQVNQYSRSVFAQSYLNNSTFYIDRDIAQKWSASLTKDHLEMLAQVRIDGFNLALPFELLAERNTVGISVILTTLKVIEFHREFQKIFPDITRQPRIESTKSRVLIEKAEHGEVFRTYMWLSSDGIESLRVLDVKAAEREIVALERF